MKARIRRAGQIEAELQDEHVDTASIPSQPGHDRQGIAPGPTREFLDTAAHLEMVEEAPRLVAHEAAPSSLGAYVWKWRTRCIV